MTITVVPLVVGAFGTVLNGLVKRLDELELIGRIKTIHPTTPMK